MVTCNTCIKAAAPEEMNWAGALELLRSVRKLSLRTDAVTWNSAADACAGQYASGAWPQALGLLEGLGRRALEADGVTTTLCIKGAKLGNS